jgi:hypothetical protein
MPGRSTHPAPPVLEAHASPTGITRRVDSGAPAPGERTSSPGASRGSVATLPHGPAGGAVVHLGRTGARVARDRAGGHPRIVSVPRRSRARCPEPYLVRVLHAVGDCSPVVIAGLADDRTALERELVRIGHQPDRFIEDCHLAGVDEALRERLRALRSHPA